jgi:hypothetical protein
LFRGGALAGRASGQGAARRHRHPGIQVRRRQRCGAGDEPGAEPERERLAGRARGRRLAERRQRERHRHAQRRAREHHAAGVEPQRFATPALTRAASGAGRACARAARASASAMFAPGHLVAAVVMAAVGTGYLLVALGPDVVAAHARGEIDGVVPRVLARLRPVSHPPRARALAIGYVVVCALAVPLAAHHALGRLGGARSPRLLGLHVAAADLYIGLAVALVARAGEATGEVLPLASARGPGRALGLLAAGLGFVLFSRGRAGACSPSQD